MDMQAKTLKVGMIGAGGIGRVHMETFAKTEGAEIVAVTDVNREAAEKAAKDYGIARVHDSAEKLIEDPDLDAVIIGVPNKWHAPLAVKALQANKHVLLEKPMAIDLNDAKKIRDAALKSDRVLMISHQMRWEGPAMAVKEKVEQGELGNIYHAKTGWFRRKGIPGWGSWFTQKQMSGGGPLIDIGVHMLDLALYLMGNPKPVSVTGSTYAEFGPKKRGIGNWGTPNWDGVFDVEDIASAFIKMEDGSSLTLDVSWAVHMDTDSMPFIHLMGSEGGASIRGNKVKILKEIDNEAKDFELVVDTDDKAARVRLSQHFIDCIREGKKPISDVMSGYTNNLILEAIYESSRTGREVILNWE
jgi:predicted dehydrogenase